MNITVYCGASLGNQTTYQLDAQEIGKWISDKQYHLVYGGGKAGLMGILANTVLENNSRVIGVIPDFLVKRELVHSGLTQLYVVHDMHERKAKMIELGDVYIALPGGPGTIEEITEVISWSRIGQHQKPCIFYNKTGYFDSLKQFFNDMIKEGFLSQSDYQTILFAHSISEIEAFIANYQPPKIRTY